MVTRITILGATGSIGDSAFELLRQTPQPFAVAAVAAGRDTAKLAAIAREFKAKLAVIAAPELFRELKDALAGTGIEAAAGKSGLLAAAAAPADAVLAGITGAAGLEPTLAALQPGRRLLLANKECLVCAGNLFMRRARETGATLLPVDSEHNAVFQALAAGPRSAVERVTLTASGGPFRTMDGAQLERVTPEQALRHPTWSMGAKISIDSATLMNKGLELIEARWLFALAPEMLEVVLHRESIIHSFIEFVDGSVLAHLAQPDMRVPIQFALSYPERLSRPEPAPDFAALGALHFAPFESARWPCVALAREAMSRGGTTPAALNAADEIAVAWFLSERIPFPAIAEIVEFALENHTPTAGDSLEELLDTDRLVRDLVERNAQKWIRSVT